MFANLNMSLDFAIPDLIVRLQLTDHIRRHPLDMTEVSRIEIMYKIKTTALYYIVVIHN